MSIIGEVAEAKRLGDECLAMAGELGSQWNTAAVHGELSSAAWGRGAYREAEQHARECLAINREIGYQEGICHSLVDLGNARYGCGAYPEARRLYEEAIALSRKSASWSERFCLTPLGFAAYAMGDYQEAEACFKRALEYEHQHPLVSAHPFIILIVGILVGVAAILTHKGQKEQALALLALTSEYPSVFKHAEEEARLIAKLAADLSPEVYAAAWKRGKGLDVKTVVGELLATWEGER